MRRVALWYAVYVAVLGGLAIYRWSVWSYGTDTGTFAQVALNAFSGFRDGPENGSHFAFHWAPLLAVLYPVVALTRSPLSIQIVQACLIGATAFPLYAFLRGYAPDRLGSRIALLALLYPPLTAVAFTEFHEIAFYPVLVLTLLWALDTERWIAFIVCSILCVLVREEVSIVLAVFGAVLLIVSLRRGERRGDGLLYWRPRAPRATGFAGAWLIVLSVATLAFYFGVVVPKLGGWRPAHFYWYPFAHGPLAFLPLRSRWMIVASPGLLIVLLSSEAITWRMGSHYAAIYIPWLLVGTAAVLVDLGRRRSEAAAQRILTVTFGLCAVVLIAFNPMHLGHYLVRPYA